MDAYGPHAASSIWDNVGCEMIYGTGDEKLAEQVEKAPWRCDRKRGDAEPAAVDVVAPFLEAARSRASVSRITVIDEAAVALYAESVVMRSAEAEGESWPRFGGGNAPHIITSIEGGGCRLTAGRQRMWLARLAMQ